MFVQVIDEFGHPPLHGPRHRDVVDHHQVIDQLAQPHPAGVGADGLAELPGHQQHRDDLVDAGKTAGVDLHVVDRVGLQQLLEQHPVHAVLAGGDADAERAHAIADAAMPQHVIRAGGLLDPQKVVMGKRLDPLDGLGHLPDLVGVDHQRHVGADHRAGDPQATLVVLGIGADLELDMAVAFVHRFPAQAGQLLVRIAEPPRRGGVAGEALLAQLGDALLLEGSLFR